MLGNENNHLLHKMKRERKRGEKRSESYRMTKVLFKIVIRLNQQIQNGKKNKQNKQIESNVRKMQKSARKCMLTSYNKNLGFRFVCSMKNDECT